MIAFIEGHRNDLGVEPICKVLPIARSTFHAHAAIARDPDLASDRAKRDAVLSPEIKRVWEEKNEVYGIRKVWHQLQREKFTIARCTVARLMKRLDIHGVIRGKVQKTTVPDKSQPCPKDKVNRKFRAPAPNMLRVSDITYVSTWQGFVYVAIIIDTFADKIVGWRVSSSPKTDFVLDALEQALHDRKPVHKGGLIHHSDRGGQYLSIRYTERLALAGIEPSVGAGSTMTELGGPYSQSFLPSLDGLQAGGEWAAKKNTRNLGKAPVRVRNVSRGTLTGFNTFAVGGAVDTHYLATRGHRLFGHPTQPLKGYFFGCVLYLC
jgi:transposase InsO family protein